jgi:hypothetical protein
MGGLAGLVKSGACRMSRACLSTNVLVWGHDVYSINFFLPGVVLHHLGSIGRSASFSKTENGQCGY